MTASIKCDFLVVGGGIVGLATSAVLSSIGSTVVIEKEASFIRHTSSRNSGVVHAGLYYPSDSLKAKLCIEGNRNIWNLVNHPSQRFAGLANKCGKWIVSTSTEEEAELETLATNMEHRCIPYRWVSRSEVQHKEPLLHVTKVLESPSTGIINVHDLADVFMSMISDSGNRNGSVAVTGTQLKKIESISEQISPSLSSSEPPIFIPRARATCNNNGEDIIIDANTVVTCMGNFSNNLWEANILQSGSSSRASIPIPKSCRTFHCKGRYVSVRSSRPPLSRLVYPCPLPNLKGLGTHSVITMDGKVIFGPDAVYMMDSDSTCTATTAVDTSKYADSYNISHEEGKGLIESSYEAIRRYLPAIEKSHLYADFVGIRPKLTKEGEASRDFSFVSIDTRNGEKVRPIAPMANIHETMTSPYATPPILAMLGIESPGLTASTAIAEHVAKIVAPNHFLKIKATLPWHYGNQTLGDPTQKL